MTTPFEREILTHHFVGPSPFPRQTGLYWQLVLQFKDMGLLRVDGGHVEGIDEPLRLYMAALDAVPLPVQRWVVP